MHRYDATHRVTLSALRGNNRSEIEFPVENLVLGAWTGRSADDVAAHVRELEALGVRGPSEVPVFYRVAASLLTTSPGIQVTRADSTGEVEFVLFRDTDTCWVGVGSDHTDRKAELIDITLAKQLCAKPIAPEVWDLGDVEDHWERLVLRSWIHTRDGRKLYQEAGVSAVSGPRDLIRSFEERQPAGFRTGTVLFSGTFANVGAFEPATKFSFELEDPVLMRRIVHKYAIRTLCSAVG